MGNSLTTDTSSSNTTPKLDLFAVWCLLTKSAGSIPLIQSFDKYSQCPLSFPDKRLPHLSLPLETVKEETRDIREVRQAAWQKDLALYPGLLAPVFIACSTNVGEGLGKLSHVV